MAYLDALGALSDPTRRKVFEAVAEGGRSVTQIADELPISRPAVSQHLKVLKGAGLVTLQTNGTKNIYQLRSEGLSELRAYLDRFWEGALSSYVREAHRKES